MKKVAILRGVYGVASMQVCAENGATDEEILAVCNAENPSGTRFNWCSVVRKPETSEGGPNEGAPSQQPCPCCDYSDRTHFVVLC